MRVLIIEDEKLAAKRLAALLQQCEASVTIIDSLDTVKKAVAWFRSQPPPDLTLMDIQLADGLSFDIFEQVTVSSPIIFTTAYDQYAIQAFKVNSVDYLLKPIGKEDLQAALHKFTSFHAVPKAEAVSHSLAQVREAIHISG